MTSQQPATTEDKPGKPTRWISVSTAVELMKKRLGRAVSKERLRQILLDHQSREDGIKARQLDVGGWWSIDQDSFETWLRDKNRVQ